MLQRQEADGLVLISQPAHAWVAGQLARQWGNNLFGHYVPLEEVRLAAALHDVGFLNWEQAPTLNPGTGLPYFFREMPTEAHFNLWSKSVHKMMRYGRYPALLVSMHFVNLCQKHRKLNSPAEFELKKKFLTEQEAFQTTVLTSLQNDVYYDPFVSLESLQRNQQLLAVWDWMSLALCIDFAGKTVFDDVPTATGTTTLALVKNSRDQVCVHPWPFGPNPGGEPMRLVCEGRRVLSTFSDEEKMRESLRAASPAIVKLELVPH